MLLTRSRLCPGASPGSSLHLHVLSTPPAFVLSQDQTLREGASAELKHAPNRFALRWCRASPNTVNRYAPRWVGSRLEPQSRRGCHSKRDATYTSRLKNDGISFSDRHASEDAGGSNLDAHNDTRLGSCVRMLLRFQRPSRPFREGDAFS